MGCDAVDEKKIFSVTRKFSECIPLFTGSKIQKETRKRIGGINVCKSQNGEGSFTFFQSTLQSKTLKSFTKRIIIKRDS